MKVISITHLRYSCQRVRANKIAVCGQIISSEYLAEILGVNNDESLKILGTELKTKGNIKRDGHEVFENGGVTRVVVENEHGKTAMGEAYCHLNDRFQKRWGVKLALGRAKKNLTRGS